MQLCFYAILFLHSIYNFSLCTISPPLTSMEKGRSPWTHASFYYSLAPSYKNSYILLSITLTTIDNCCVLMGSDFDVA